MGTIPWYKNDNFVRAYRTFLVTFLGLFLISLIGWLHEVITWATSDGYAFPHVSVLVKAAVSASAAAFIAVLSFVQNVIETQSGKSIGPK